MFQYCVDEAAAGQRLDKFLALQLPHLSRTKVKEAIDSGGALVNGAVAKPSLTLKPEDRISFRLEVRKAGEESMPEDLPLEILYEDEFLAVIEKPAGMVVHAGAGVRSGTLVNALRFHLRSLSQAPDGIRPGIVHRLDKLTSGIMVVAKTDAAHAALSEQFRVRRVEKKYLALVHGRLPRRTGEIALPLARDRVHRTRMTTRRQQGREALTRYRVLREFEKYSLLEVEIKTGRTHQIRAHLSAIGHPVVGDRTYGAPHQIWWPGQSTTTPTLDRHFLHAAHLGFEHPADRRRMSFDSPLPPLLADFLAACEKSTAPVSAVG
ncbi:MAG: RluA family pseudouridine synthase [Acidobacteriia bacterium]|nr:RluA family pseudouridine synthase [Terriglobia bacterium]